jgi:hypothetical protein
LKALCFKQDYEHGKVRLHWIVLDGQAEITRFGLEYDKMPDDERIMSDVKRVLEEIAKHFGITTPLEVQF